MDTFNVIAGLATLLSVSVNIFQWLWSRRSRDERFIDIESTYSALHSFAARCENITAKLQPTPEIRAQVDANPRWH